MQQVGAENKAFAVHFSSKRDDWATPQPFFDRLEKEFAFTLDPCCSTATAKCVRFYTIDDDGLSKSWDGRAIGAWVAKAATEEAQVVVCLLPARTDTRWFHDYIYGNPRAEIRFLKGRLRFDGHKASAPFPSMIVVFRRLEVLQ